MMHVLHFTMLTHSQSSDSVSQQMMEHNNVPKHTYWKKLLILSKVRVQLLGKTTMTALQKCAHRQKVHKTGGK